MGMTVRNLTKGIKGTTKIRTARATQKGKRYTAEPQYKVDICLSCTKPVSECKGKCFGGV
jgi:hypothetical protein